ncbi:hypothetical protein [Aliidiomarina minuta]|uniref:hypothetical protein n=1 Tax=Aliidiomarina minuta TaxID=880057 RepID=UPI003B82D759
MANALGPSDTFVSEGQTAAWDPSGALLAQMNNNHEGILILDLESRRTQMV